MKSSQLVAPAPAAAQPAARLRRRAGRVFAGCALLVNVVGALVACSGADTPPPQRPEPVLSPVPLEPQPSTQPTLAAPARTRADAAPPGTRRPAVRETAALESMDQFVARVQQELPQVAADRRDEELAALGEQMCASLAAGRGTAAVAGEMQDQGVVAADDRALVASARAEICL